MPKSASRSKWGRSLARPAGAFVAVASVVAGSMAACASADTVVLSLEPPPVSTTAGPRTIDGAPYFDVASRAQLRGRARVASRPSPSGDASTPRPSSSTAGGTPPAKAAVPRPPQSQSPAKSPANSPTQGPTRAPAAAPAATSSEPSRSSSSAPPPPNTSKAPTEPPESTAPAGSTDSPVAGAVAGVDAIPMTDPFGQQLRWYDDFSSSSLGSGWTPYTGRPQSAKETDWVAKNVFTSNGKLVLRMNKSSNGRWEGGGVMNSDNAGTTFGGYQVRFRMPHAVGLKYVVLLWPDSENWPVDGEIDFAEDGRGSRSQTMLVLHHGENNEQVKRTVDADFSTWHTVGLQWSPGSLVTTLDGEQWGSISSAGVPIKKMNLVIQTETLDCGDPEFPCPDSSTPDVVDMEVDWVALYR